MLDSLRRSQIGEVLNYDRNMNLQVISLERRAVANMNDDTDLFCDAEPDRVRYLQQSSRQTDSAIGQEASGDSIHAAIPVDACTRAALRNSRHGDIQHFRDHYKLQRMRGVLPGEQLASDQTNDTGLRSQCAVVRLLHYGRLENCNKRIPRPLPRRAAARIYPAILL